MPPLEASGVVRGKTQDTRTAVRRHLTLVELPVAKLERVPMYGWKELFLNLSEDSSRANRQRTWKNGCVPQRYRGGNARSFARAVARLDRDRCATPVQVHEDALRPIVRIDLQRTTDEPGACAQQLKPLGFLRSAFVHGVLVLLQFRLRAFEG